MAKKSKDVQQVATPQPRGDPGGEFLFSPTKLAAVFNVALPTIKVWVNQGLPVYCVEAGDQNRPLFHLTQAIDWWRLNIAESPVRLKHGLGANAEVLRDAIDGRAALREITDVQAELIEIDYELKYEDRRLLREGVNVVNLENPTGDEILEVITDNHIRTVTLRLGALKMRTEIANRLLAKKLPDYKPTEYNINAEVSPDEVAARIRTFIGMANVADGVLIEHKPEPPEPVD